ncbi:MAG: hypothetical protein RLZZ436_1067 [Planctomycetota bacterium]
MINGLLRKTSITTFCLTTMIGDVKLGRLVLWGILMIQEDWRHGHIFPTMRRLEAKPNPAGRCRKASEEKCTVQTGTLFGLLSDVERY